MDFTSGLEALGIKAGAVWDRFDLKKEMDLFGKNNGFAVKFVSHAIVCVNEGHSPHIAVDNHHKLAEQTQRKKAKLLAAGSGQWKWDGVVDDQTLLEVKTRHQHKKPRKKKSTRCNCPMKVRYRPLTTDFATPAATSAAAAAPAAAATSITSATTAVLCIRCRTAYQLLHNSLGKEEEGEGVHFLVPVQLLQQVRTRKKTDKTRTEVG